jgi:hypothetical protein
MPQRASKRDQPAHGRGPWVIVFKGRSLSLSVRDNHIDNQAQRPRAAYALARRLRRLGLS